MRKPLAILVLLTLPACACGPSFGPEILLWIAGILFVLGIPHLAAPLVAMALARRPGYRLTKAARIGTFFAGCGLSLLVMFMLPTWLGYWTGLFVSGFACLAFSRHQQVEITEEPPDIGFSRVR